MVHSIKGFFNIDEHSTGKKFLSILIRIDYTISSMACLVKYAPRKPYWDEDNKLCVSMKPFILLYIFFFSKMVLKFYNNEIGL